MLVLPLVDSTDVVSVVSSGAASDTSVSDAAVSDASVVSGVALSRTGAVSPHPVNKTADIINAEIIDNNCFLMVVILLSKLIVPYSRKNKKKILRMFSPFIRLACSFSVPFVFF